ncbi:MAG: shikimate kinase [Rhodospirillales bacterium]
MAGFQQSRPDEQPVSAEPRLLPLLPSARSVVLIGLMGAGKTSIGRRLAKRLGVTFVDSDDEIAKAAGCSVQDIFARFGEPAFRDGERRVIARLLAESPQVMATGGGAFLDPTTRQGIRAHGVSVWLKAELDVLVRRTEGRPGRPLLNAGDPRAILERLIAERYPVYGLADLTVLSEDVPIEATVDKVVAALRRYGRGMEVAR